MGLKSICDDIVTFDISKATRPPPEQLVDFRRFLRERHCVINLGIEEEEDARVSRARSTSFERE